MNNIVYLVLLRNFFKKKYDNLKDIKSKDAYIRGKLDAYKDIVLHYNKLLEKTSHIKNIEFDDWGKFQV